MTRADSLLLALRTRRPAIAAGVALGLGEEVTLGAALGAAQLGFSGGEPLLRDDLEAKGPVRVSDVETAQKEILTIARRMAEAGEIVLGGKGAEEMI